MFEQKLKTYQAALNHHPLYGAIRTKVHLRVFMSHHAFAVWDFMSLAKRLQNDLTCTQIPWLPVKDEGSARLINEIITGEESDVDPSGNPISHYNLYLGAMREVKASTHNIETFVSQYRATTSLNKALDVSGAPHYVKDFVRNTLATAYTGTTAEVASSFLFGREDPIPKMFHSLLGNWGLNEHHAPKFTYYLKRHIEVDSGEHGPAAENMLSSLMVDSRSRQRALDAAINAIEHRIMLWNGVYEDIKRLSSGNADR